MGTAGSVVPGASVTGGPAIDGGTVAWGPAAGSLGPATSPGRVVVLPDCAVVVAGTAEVVAAGDVVVVHGAGDAVNFAVRLGKHPDRRALKHGQVRHLVDDRRHQLQRRRSCPDHCYPLAGQGDVVIPQRGVHEHAAEIL